MPASQMHEPRAWTWTGPSLADALSSYRVAIVVAVVAAVAAGFLLAVVRPKTYTATATIVLAEGGMLGEDGGDPARAVERSAARLSSRAVLDGVAEELADIDREELEDVVSIEPDEGAGLIDVVAADPTPSGAAEIANVVTATYERVSRDYAASQLDEADKVLLAQSEELAGQVAEQRQEVAANPSDAAAQQRLEVLQAQQQELQARLGQLAADAALFGAGIQSVDEAVAPTEPTSPVPLRDAALAGVVGLALAIGFAYWRAQYVAAKTTDPSAILGAPVLAQIPNFAHLNGTFGDPRFDREAAEAYQFLLSSFEFSVAQTGARSVVVTSVGPGDGKSLTALHLARALAVQGRDVVLVDSDIRARGVTTMLNADNADGLSGLVEGMTVEDVTRRYRISDAAQLAVIPAGAPPRQPTGLLATSRYRDALARVIASHDLTIVDGAPLLTVADASAVAAQVGGVLLVLDRNATTDDLVKVRDRLQLISTPLLGYIVNRVSDGLQFFDYTYGDDAHHARRFRQARPPSSQRNAGGPALGRPRDGHGHATDTSWVSAGSDQGQ
jgi:capsular exopolysaccharide synthesis family protein